MFYLSWQAEFVKLFEELENEFGWMPDDAEYKVTLQDKDGNVIPDPLMDYDRGRRVISPKGKDNE